MFEICAPSPELIKAALYHDTAECEIGDVPANAKWRHPDLRRVMHEVEAQVEREYEVGVYLNPDEKHMLKIADAIDMLFYALHERKMGNKFMDIVFDRVIDHLEKFATPDHHEAWNLIRAITEEYDSVCK